MQYSDLTVVIPTKEKPSAVASLVSSIPANISVVIVESCRDEMHEACLDRATVRYFDWNGTYPKKRNWALDGGLVKTKWVLFLDDDEQVSEAGFREIQRKIRTSKHDAFWLSFNLKFSDAKLRFGVVQRKLVLFKWEKFRYEKVNISANEKFDMEIHEHPIPVCKKVSYGKLRLRALHEENLSLERNLLKHFEYAKWEASQFGKRTSPNATLRQRVKYALLNSELFPPLYFLLDYMLFLRVLDGFAGLRYAMMKYIYFSLVVEKVRAEKS